MCLFFFRRKKKKYKAVETANEEPVREDAEQKPEQIAPVKQTAVEVKREKSPNEVVRTDNGKVLVRVRYNRSHTAKLIQGDDKLKGYYSEIKNELLRYLVANRISWRYETFKTGRKLIARLAVRGKTLYLYLDLDPKQYPDTKYKINDVSAIANNAGVPLLYKIKNDRRCRYAKELIFAAMRRNGLSRGEGESVDYSALYPYEPIEPLLERRLIKLLKWKEKGESAEEGTIEISRTAYEQLAEEAELERVTESVSVAEAEEKMADEEAEAQVKISDRIADKSKKDIVNIDVLGRYFKAGETVTVKEIAKRVPSVNDRATYIKVLARGTLDKPLHIEADDFSLAAVKMIVLTGGTVSRTKSN